MDDNSAPAAAPATAAVSQAVATAAAGTGTGATARTLSWVDGVMGVCAWGAWRCNHFTAVCVSGRVGGGVGWGVGVEQTVTDVAPVALRSPMFARSPPPLPQSQGPSSRPP